MHRHRVYSEQMMSLLPRLINNPHAMAEISGSEDYLEIKGRAHFLQANEGVWLMVEVFGLPASKLCEGGIFGFHIHEGWLCRGNEEDAFAGAMGHYNPEKCKHPYHAGDLPPLFGNNGHAFMIMMTDNFFVEEVIGRTIIVHSKVDDFTSQPAGNAGTKMACGQIRRMCPDR